VKLIILALLLALTATTAWAVPLQGSDGNATVVLFGSTRTPLADENATQEILKVDIGLVNTENATYELVDQNDKTYPPGLFKTLQEKRHLVYFLVPQDDLFKLIRVIPTGGKSFNINWWATPKSAGGDVVVRYYGISDWLINPDEQGVVVQVRVANNGTKDLYLTPENFTLLDQWGWPYLPTLGFDPEVIGPQKASSDRVKVGFTGISLLSKPAALAYNYGSSSQVLINLENDLVALTDDKVYGANATQNATSSASAPSSSENAALVQPSSNQTQSQAASAGNETNKTASATATKLGSLKEQIAASKARLAGKENATASGQESAVGQKINSSLSSTKERLAAAKANLHKSTQSETKSDDQNATTNSTISSTTNSTLNSTLNNTTNSTLNGAAPSTMQTT
jgi:hypothetical protein